MNIYKPTEHSYSITKGKDRGKNPKTGIGIPELTHLCKAGRKDLRGKKRDQFNLCCYLAADEGFDYILLKNSVTNSQREEPVQFSSYSIGLGSTLFVKGKKLTDFSPVDSYVLVPDKNMPKRYANIPDYKEPDPVPQPKPILPGSQIGIETDEDYDVLVQMVTETLRQKNGKFARKLRKAVLSCAYHVLFEAVKEIDA